MTAPTIPPGWWLLKDGERIEKGDKYSISNNGIWIVCRKGGGKWNPDRYWPMIRKVEP